MFYLFVVLICGTFCLCLYACDAVSAVLGCDLIIMNGTYWGVCLQLDYVTIFISLMLYVCFCYVYRYTIHYFGKGVEEELLNKMICLFVAVMGMLVLTGDYLSTLVLWEYLGVVSFFLILFYGSCLSLRSSVVTLVSSRFGDVCLFLLVGSSYYFFNLSFLSSFVLFCVVIMTKSASYPFVSWLLEAMRAPTPVSSLVHSSTLVAAGVWFAIRYDFTATTTGSVTISVILLLTIFITGLCSFFFIDLKKIVALSTCNNISWCVFYLIFGDVLLALFQLVSHGVSKCLLFILVGDAMSGSSGAQSINCMYAPRLYNNWGVFGLFSVVLGLSGAPFIGVFFTKHLLLCSFGGVANVLLYIVVFFCVFLSYFYSFRLCGILVNLSSGSVYGVMFFFNSGLIWVFWLSVNFFFGNSIEELNSLGVISGVLLVALQLVCVIVAYYFYCSCLMSNWSSSLFGCDTLVESFYNIYSYAVSLFVGCYYRWDSYVISLFYQGGSGVTGAYGNSVLNLSIISLALLVGWICLML
nr:NADH dehydrogenase subunit 5 [Cylindrotaenia sp. MN-2022]